MDPGSSKAGVTIRFVVPVYFGLKRLNWTTVNQPGHDETKKKP